MRVELNLWRNCEMCGAGVYRTTDDGMYLRNCECGVIIRWRQCDYCSNMLPVFKQNASGGEVFLPCYCKIREQLTTIIGLLDDAILKRKVEEAVSLLQSSL